ncbi:MAG TPA: dienelactone hydrolase family protein [Nitrososphaerales archaeon]|nr:dienelactone hydrolase family protein [Nitrososphaerales archaeon]HUK74575.1 dienelactone hydrolase family protein [Nitrososphaerales archaeon]
MEGFFRYPVKDGNAEAYAAEPVGRRAAGQVLVVHEVWGFTRFIRKTCDDLSNEGFRAVAPVLYWRDRDVFSEKNIREGLKTVWGLSLEERRQRAKLEAAIEKGGASPAAASMLRKLYDPGFRARILEDLVSLARHSRRERPDLALGALGFSMGGKMAMQTAAAFGGMAACVAVSSEPLVGPSLGKVRAPLLLLYGSDDAFMLRSLPAFVEEAVSRGKAVALKLYPSAGHEFFDPAHKDYLPAAAKDARESALDFMRKCLA